MAILTLNPGSSSLKFGLYQMADQEPDHELDRGPDGLTELLVGAVERVGTAEAKLAWRTGNDPPMSEPVQAGGRPQAVAALMPRVEAHLPGSRLEAIGVRVVHGGARFIEPTRITPEIVTGLRELTPLAPLHIPADAEVLELCLRLHPDVPLVAVFDTAFHATLPEVARTYALPHDVAERFGLRRYGFHGISHQYVSERLRASVRPDRGGRCITCHLGNGASLCAVRDGRSIDTTMGMTPMEGLVMGTRSGDVDPGLLLYLLRTVGVPADRLNADLNRRSGLLGVSGRSLDVRDLESAAAAGDRRAELALDLFAYRAAKAVAAQAVALEGLDALAFCGGIGEHSASMRARICSRLAFLGIRLDGERNRAATGQDAVRISGPEGQVEVWVIPTDENRQIAWEVFGLLGEAKSS